MLSTLDHCRLALVIVLPGSVSGLLGPAPRPRYTQDTMQMFPRGGQMVQGFPNARPPFGNLQPQGGMNYQGSPKMSPPWAMGSVGAVPSWQQGAPSYGFGQRMPDPAVQWIGPPMQTVPPLRSQQPNAGPQPGQYRQPSAQERAAQRASRWGETRPEARQVRAADRAARMAHPMNGQTVTQRSAGWMAEHGQPANRGNSWMHGVQSDRQVKRLSQRAAHNSAANEMQVQDPMHTTSHSANHQAIFRSGSPRSRQIGATRSTNSAPIAGAGRFGQALTHAMAQPEAKQMPSAFRQAGPTTSLVPAQMTNPRRSIVGEQPDRQTQRAAGWGLSSSQATRSANERALDRTMRPKGAKTPGKGSMKQPDVPCMVQPANHRSNAMAISNRGTPPDDVSGVRAAGWGQSAAAEARSADDRAAVRCLRMTRSANPTGTSARNFAPQTSILPSMASTAPNGLRQTCLGTMQTMPTSATPMSGIAVTNAKSAAEAGGSAAMASSLSAKESAMDLASKAWVSRLDSPSWSAASKELSRMSNEATVMAALSEEATSGNETARHALAGKEASWEDQMNFPPWNKPVHKEALPSWATVAAELSKAAEIATGMANSTEKQTRGGPDTMAAKEPSTGWSVHAPEGVSPGPPCDPVSAPGTMPFASAGTPPGSWPMPYDGRAEMLFDAPLDMFFAPPPGMPFGPDEYGVEDFHLRMLKDRQAGSSTKAPVEEGAREEKEM